MCSEIPTESAKLMRDRRALLWICQGHDLLPGVHPHAYDTPSSEAELLYRSDAKDTDTILASFYWEAIWTESARSHVVEAIRTANRDDANAQGRSVVLLASAGDAEADVSSRQFLPICALAGLLGPSVPPGAAYGLVKGRVRERIAWQLCERIERYPGRLLVVLGARDEGDLKSVRTAIEDCNLTDLHVLIVWPQELPAVSPFDNPAVDSSVWQGGTEQFCDALREAGAPGAGDIPSWALRLGNKSVELRAHDVEPVLKRFALITERDLSANPQFGMRDLLDFLGCSLDNWSAYHEGLPVPRSYLTDKSQSLIDELRLALSAAQGRRDGVRTVVLHLPCQAGAGGTTAIRAAAFQLAREGHPVLILRPEQTDVDIEDVLAFATAVNEASLAAGLDEVPPLVVVADIEHSTIKRLRRLLDNLAGNGRRAVLLQAMPWADDSEASAQREPRYVRLSPMRAHATPEEVNLCEARFRTIVERHALPLTVPSVDQWRAYQQGMRWLAPGGSFDPTDLFWVALRFFVTEGADYSVADLTRDAVGQWVSKRTEGVRGSALSPVVDYVAVLSSFRLVSPLTTILRPVTGGSFTSDLVPMLRDLSAVLDWGDSSEDLGDWTLRFTHPALADEYLRQRDVGRPSERIEMVKPVLSGLSLGHAGDLWLAESLTVNVLAPRYDERRITDWDWRLAAFEAICPELRDNSKVILHHWARCWYLSAEAVATSVSAAELLRRHETAIQKLMRAIEIPGKLGADEHPSHLYNTLGTAMSRLAQLHEREGDERASLKAWEQACDAFGKAISTSGSTNVEALLAFSRRLLHHDSGDGAGDRLSEVRVDELATALHLLDEADDVIAASANPDPDLEQQAGECRARVLEKLEQGAGISYARQLTESANASLGYYCLAVLFAKDQDPSGVAEAISVLQGAEQQGVRLDQRCLMLLWSLMSRDTRHSHDYVFLRRLQERIQTSSGYTTRPIDLFRLGVLCYNTEDYDRGKETFRQLRELLRRTGMALSVRDYWRDASQPARPRVTTAKVTRLVTEWRAQGFVQDMGQIVPLRPRHFSPPPSENEVVQCIIRFEANGPLAVPTRFYGEEAK